MLEVSHVTILFFCKLSDKNPAYKICDGSIGKYISKRLSANGGTCPKWSNSRNIKGMNYFGIITCLQTLYW